MASVDLLFEHPPATDGHLLFGDAGGGPPPALIEATLAAALGWLSLAAVGQYRSQTARPTVGERRGPWQWANHGNESLGARHQDALRILPGRAGRWQRAADRPVGFEHRLPERFAPQPVRLTTRFQDGIAAGIGRRFKHDDAIRERLARSGRWQAGIEIGPALAARQHDMLRDRRLWRQAFWQDARALDRRHDARFQWALGLPVGTAARHQDCRRPPPGVTVWVVPPSPPGPACYTPDPHLVFRAAPALDAHLLFVCDNAARPLVVPVLKVYVVLNNVTLVRLPDNTPLPAFGLSLALDIESWAWGFEAQLPASAEPLVSPGASGPVELLATVNGTPFRLIAETLARERIFGSASIRLSGRGRTAALAAPYAPVFSTAQPIARTANQLAEDTLTLNGVPIGWTVDWQLEDWLVPAGVFVRQGTWIEHLLAIAQAAGGYVAPHRTAQQVAIRHRYPISPWDWATATPALVLPADAVERESLRWSDKPVYNRVFVAGEGAGVLGQVTRAGTAGDAVAPMVVDPLITEAAAARQRGRAVLADTGRQIEATLRLPVLAETGIIEPGLFVEYQDGSVARRGYVRSTRIECGFPDVWQTIGVETRA